MELNQEYSTRDSLLIGLEEIYEDPFFMRLRFALNKPSERRRLYEILTTISCLKTNSASFLIKMRDSLDRYDQKDFWVWFIRALKEIESDHRGLNSLRKILEPKDQFEFNKSLLAFLESPYSRHQPLFAATKRALEHSHSEFCIESLRIFDEFQAPEMQLIKRLRQNMENFDTDSDLQLFLKGIEIFPQWSWTSRIRSTLKKYPRVFRFDSFSRSQIQSKKWALAKIEEIFGHSLEFVQIMCGWYGLLGTLMLLSNKFEKLKVRSYDIDPSCELIANELNRPWMEANWKFKAFTRDVSQLEYQHDEVPRIIMNYESRHYRERISLIVNTSCEHMGNFKEWFEGLPKNAPILLQSNDAFHESEHINCVKTLEEFKSQVPMSKILYEGTLPLENFNRFMLIGYK